MQILPAHLLAPGGTAAPQCWGSAAGLRHERQQCWIWHTPVCDKRLVFAAKLLALARRRGCSLPLAAYLCGCEADALLRVIVPEECVEVVEAAR